MTFEYVPSLFYCFSVSMTEVLFFKTVRFQLQFLRMRFIFSPLSRISRTGRQCINSICPFLNLTLLNQIRTSEMSYKHWTVVFSRDFIFIFPTISLVTFCITLSMQRSSLGAKFPNMRSEGHVIFHVQDKFEICLFQINSSVLSLLGSRSFGFHSRFCTTFSWGLFSF